MLDCVFHLFCITIDTPFWTMTSHIIGFFFSTELIQDPKSRKLVCCKRFFLFCFHLLFLCCFCFCFFFLFVVFVLVLIFEGVYCVFFCVCYLSTIWSFVWYHFQQYFSYIVAISFIGGGNRSAWRKQSTCCKSLTNFIT